MDVIKEICEMELLPTVVQQWETDETSFSWWDIKNGAENRVAVRIEYYLECRGIYHKELKVTIFRKKKNQELLSLIIYFLCDKNNIKKKGKEREKNTSKFTLKLTIGRKKKKNNIRKSKSL